MKIIKVIGNVFSVLSVIVIALLLTPTILQYAGYNSFVILSASMEPVIDTGSIVFVDSSDTDIEVGDIILYRLSNTNIVHRVIEIQENGDLVTKGDNNDGQDFEPIKDYQVYGTVMKMPWGGWCVPYAGYISNFIQAYRIYLIIAVIAVVVFQVCMIFINED